MQSFIKMSSDEYQSMIDSTCRYVDVFAMAFGVPLLRRKAKIAERKREEYVEYTLIVLIVEQTDITGSRTVQTIFQRDVVNEGFGIIRRIFARRYLTTDYNLEAVIEEALRITETVIRTLAAGIRGVMIFDTHRDAGILQVTHQ